MFPTDAVSVSGQVTNNTVAVVNTGANFTVLYASVNSVGVTAATTGVQTFRLVCSLPGGGTQDLVAAAPQKPAIESHGRAEFWGVRVCNKVDFVNNYANQTAAYSVTYVPYDVSLRTSLLATRDSGDMIFLMGVQIFFMAIIFMSFLFSTFLKRRSS
jgi:hypothetical protein